MIAWTWHLSIVCLDPDFVIGNVAVKKMNTVLHCRFVSRVSRWVANNVDTD